MLTNTEGQKDGTKEETAWADVKAVLFNMILALMLSSLVSRFSRTNQTLQSDNLDLGG